MTTRTHNATHQIDTTALAARCDRFHYRFIVVDEDGSASVCYVVRPAAERMANRTTHLLYDRAADRVRVVDFAARNEAARLERVKAAGCGEGA